MPRTVRARSQYLQKAFRESRRNPRARDYDMDEHGTQLGTIPFHSNLQRRTSLRAAAPECPGELREWRYGRDRPGESHAPVQHIRATRPLSLKRSGPCGLIRANL